MKTAIFYKGKFFEYLTSEKTTKKEVDIIARSLGLIRSEVEIRDYDFNFETPHYFEGENLIPFEIEQKTEEIDEIVEEIDENDDRKPPIRRVEKRQVNVREMKKMKPITPRKILK